MNVTALALLGLATTLGQPALPDAQDFQVTKVRTHKLGVNYKPERKKDIQEARLFVSRDQGQDVGNGAGDPADTGRVHLHSQGRRTLLHQHAARLHQRPGRAGRCQPGATRAEAGDRLDGPDRPRHFRGAATGKRSSPSGPSKTNSRTMPPRKSSIALALRAPTPTGKRVPEGSITKRSGEVQIAGRWAGGAANRDARLWPGMSAGRIRKSAATKGLSTASVGSARHGDTEPGRFPVNPEVHGPVIRLPSLTEFRRTSMNPAGGTLQYAGDTGMHDGTGFRSAR